MLNLTLPIYWTNQKVRVKSTTHLVGLNWHRNAYHMVQNKFKQEFHELVLNQLEQPLPKFNRFRTHYNLYYKVPNCDPSNIIPMIEKVTLDALQAAGILPEDTVKYHTESSWYVIEQSKDNPRCEISIIPIKEPND